MDVKLLRQVATRPFVADLKLSADEAVYYGSVIPLPGRTEICVTTSGIDASIKDDTGWHHRAWQALPAGTIGDPALVFRPVVPGRMIEPKYLGRIETAAGWSAGDVSYCGEKRHFGRGDSSDTYSFRVGRLRIDGPAVHAPVVAARTIYRRGAFGGADEIDGKLVVAHVLTPDDTASNEEMTAVTYDFVPDEVTLDAVWNVANLIVGNTLQQLAMEHLAEDGRIVYTEHRIGVESTDARQPFFHRLFPDYGKLATGGFSVLATGTRRLLAKGFPIDIVLYHLHMAAGEAADIEAQHLVLALHTAIEAWTRFSGRERLMTDKQWQTMRRALRAPMERLPLYAQIGDEVRNNVLIGMKKANETTTGWRQKFLFESLDIDVSSPDDVRALKYRDELLHNGYFLKRWHDLTFHDQQERFHDVERLRRLTLLVIFKMVGYTGDFQNPITFFKDHVDSSKVVLPGMLN